MKRITRHGRWTDAFVWGIVIIGSIANARLGGAATYYVASNGADANAGTEGQPFRSLARGVSDLTPGDTLYVKEGTYTGSNQLGRTPSGTSWDRPVTIAAYPEHQPVIVPEPGNHVLYFIGNQYIIIDGFIIDGAGGSDGIKITYGFAPQAHHIRIQNSEIKNAPDNGILAAGEGNEFINLDIHNNGTSSFNHGVYVVSSNNLVEGCAIYDNSGWGIHIYNGSWNGTNDNVIRNNEIYNNGQSGRGVGILLSSGSGNVAFDNIVNGNPGGIQVDYGASDTHVYNNTIGRNDEYGIYVGAGSSGVLIENNSFDANNGPAISDAGSGTVIHP